MTQRLSLLFACCVCVVPAPTLAAPAVPVSAVAYHPSGTFVAVGSHGRVAAFDVSTGAMPGAVTDLPGRVTALAFDPAGKLLAVACGEPGKAGLVRLLRPSPDCATFVTVAEAARAHADSVYGLAFSPDGRTLATAGYDRVIHLWSVPAAKADAPPAALETPVRTLKDHSDTVYALAWSPDGALLASASADRTVKVWDAAAGTRLYTLGDPTDWVYALGWSPDGTRLVAGGVDRSIRVWAAGRDGGTLLRSAFAHDKAVLRVAYGPDGKTLFSVGEDRVIKAWDADRLKEVVTLPTQPDTVLAFALRPDDKQVAVGRFDGFAALHDAATGKPQIQLLPAKPVPPAVKSAAPAFAPRGRTVTVTLAGKGLDSVTAVTSTVPGVVAKLTTKTPTADALELALTVPANAPPGPLPLTLEGPAGKATTAAFVVDRFPAVAEAGSTDSARTGMSVTLPATVAGAIDRAGDVDFFRFEAAAGQQVGVQVVAAEVGSKLDPVLVLTDAGGRTLAEGAATLGYTVPTAGTYAVGIRDRDYRGGPDMTYRLHVGPVPVVTGVFPLGVARGTTASVRVAGVNLGPVAAVAVAVPADAVAGSRVAVKVPPGVGGEVPLGAASVGVGEFPAVAVVANAVELPAVPATADGVLADPGDAHAVRFRAAKGAPLVIEVHAGRVGSPVDSAIEIRDAAGRPVPRAVLRSTAKTFVTLRDHDADKPGIRLDAWNDLAIGDLLYADGELMRIQAMPRGPDDDCLFFQVGGKRVGFLGTTPAFHAFGNTLYRVEPHPPGTTFAPNGMPVFTLFHRNDDGGPGFGADSYLAFDPPADGIYQVKVRDARGAGGPTHAYRLTVRPPRPDFAVRVSPESAAVWKGGGVPLTITVTRTDGFAGPVRVRFAGLPPGFHAPDTTVEADLTTATVSLFADADAAAPPKAGAFKVTAGATIGGRDVVRDASLGVPTLADGADLVTTVGQSEVVLAPGRETKFVVAVERRNGFAGRVPLDVLGLPHGVRVLNVGLNGILVTERETSREVTLYAEPWVEPTSRPFVVLAKREGKKAEHAARSVLLRVAK